MNLRSPKTWLAASLMANLFLLTGIGGAAWRWHAANAAPAPAAQGRGLRYVAEELPPAQRKTLRQGLRQARTASAPAQQDGREARREVVKLLAADRFDGAALASALARAREADLAARTRMEGAIVEFAARLTPEERRRLVDSLQRHTNLAGTPQPAKK